ncbi:MULTISPECIES: hypothetical protein [Burkholderia]|uniref:hypothetical protein n=1 Tax=Burkholderia TaxID=32008 RepID=UPI000B91DA90|nr:MULTISPECIES: hypothetical protein [Burkholderia]OXI24355.1 hypothetical protein CFB43_06575 [Burkholderia sp. AU15512]VWD60919.1 hypothetical protein BLA18628_07203 [Burkholderia aenigmatica]
MNVVQFPRDTTPETLGENLTEFARDGNVKWVVMVIVEADDSLRFEWSKLPSNLAALGAVEFLKQHLMSI